MTPNLITQILFLFLALMSLRVASQGLDQGEALFAQIDSDGDGYISKEEMATEILRAIQEAGMNNS